MSKRPLDIDSSTSTPSKKATIRRSQASNKRSSEEVGSELTTAGSKKARQQLEEEDNVDAGEKSLKKHPVRRNTERLSSLLEKNNIVSSPAAWKRPTHFKEGEEEHEDLGVDREKKPVSRKPTVTNTVKSNEATVNIEISKPNVPRSSAVHAILNNAEPKPITTVPSAVPISIADYNSASLKVPSTLDLSNNVVGGGLACFWTQCREALSFCCATLYPSFLGVIVTAYLLHFTTNERVFASFAVVFTILSGLVLGFLFVAVVPFVVLTRTVERYFREKDSPESVFVNLLTRMMLLLITILVLYGIQSLPLLF